MNEAAKPQCDHQGSDLKAKLSFIISSVWLVPGCQFVALPNRLSTCLNTKGHSLKDTGLPKK